MNTFVSEGAALIGETLATPLTPTLTVGGLLVGGALVVGGIAVTRFALQKIGVLN